jgi:hypothetical protein
VKNYNGRINLFTIFVPFVKLYHSHQIIKKMKKIAYLFVACALFGVIALSSCKSKTAEPAAAPTVVEDTTAAAPADTTAPDTTVAQ